MPEVDWFGQTDIFGNDFTPTINQTFETPHSESDASAQVQQESGAGISQSRNGHEAVKRRHAVFKQSAWLWYPKHNQRAFGDDETIAFDERNVDLASSPHPPYSSNVIIPDQLQQPARDRIFQLVTKTARSQISIPTFPSADCLDKLMKVGIAKRVETDAWIHPYTFDSDKSRPEFLAALVAAGCICFGIPSVNKTGLVLQEIVRVALSSLVEQDNSVMRDLQYLQASMIWLDIGAFCGFRRKMEIAESSLQALVTALRRAGRLDYVRYPLITPNAEDGEEALDTKWRQWVELESYKRLVYHLFEHDINMTIVKQRQPLISYAEVTVFLPASKLLWLAPSAEVWRASFLGLNLNLSHSDTRPSLRSTLQSEGAVLSLHTYIDTQFARSAYLHGIAAQVWEHFQQATVLQDSNDPSSQLWSRARHQKLYLCLQNAGISLDTAPAITCVLHQFLQMLLHINLDDVVRFAGKCGEEAAHKAYVALQPWSRTKEARIAISHAGQVLQVARAIPPYENRGQDSFMIYHATMVLWTYSMMVSDRERKTRANTPIDTPHPSTRDHPHMFFLDEPLSSNQSDVDAFILLERGTPCLRMPRMGANMLAPTPGQYEICTLRHPADVMKVGVQLLDGTHLDVDRGSGPPLLRALCGILEELGRLS
ncbi:C2H2 type zinc finger domain-containing protein [Phaeosphaeriaceae sp. PMI808]|nr:C2H2 type zinc finger domain-containing protein [Phaeosphaeriaceae sp. PMI808]